MGEIKMKTTKYVLSFLVSSLSSSNSIVHENYLGCATDGGSLISVTTDKKSLLKKVIYKLI